MPIVPPISTGSSLPNVAPQSYVGIESDPEIQNFVQDTNAVLPSVPAGSSLVLGDQCNI